MIVKLACIAGLAVPALAALGAPKGSADLGKKIFTAKCVTCHGKDGKGVASMAKMFHVDPLHMDWTSAANKTKTDAELTKTVHDGNGKMPSFKASLKDDDIANVIAYVRSLQKGSGSK